MQLDKGWDNFTEIARKTTVKRASGAVAGGAPLPFLGKIMPGGGGNQPFCLPDEEGLRSWEWGITEQTVRPRTMSSQASIQCLTWITEYGSHVLDQGPDLRCTSVSGVNFLGGDDFPCTDIQIANGARIIEPYLFCRVYIVRDTKEYSVMCHEDSTETAFITKNWQIIQYILPIQRIRETILQCYILYSAAIKRINGEDPRSKFTFVFEWTNSNNNSLIVCIGNALGVDKKCFDCYA